MNKCVFKECWCYVGKGPVPVTCARNLRVQPCLNLSFYWSVGSEKSRFGLDVSNSILCSSSGELHMVAHARLLFIVSSYYPHHAKLHKIIATINKTFVDARWQQTFQNVLSIPINKPKQTVTHRVPMTEG